MIATLDLLTLVATTLFAATIAVAMHWVLLRAIFVLMRPASAKRVTAETHLVRATARLAREYAFDR
jgi:hypothetical protein